MAYQYLRAKPADCVALYPQDIRFPGPGARSMYWVVYAASNAANCLGVHPLESWTAGKCPLGEVLMSACSDIDLGASGCYFGEGFAEGSKPGRYVILYFIGRKIPY